MSAAPQVGATPSWLADIAAAATTIDERMRGEVDVLPDPRLANARLDRWMTKVAEGDVARFRRRLAASGWDEAQVTIALGRARWRPDRPLPDWTSTVAAAVDVAVASGPSSLDDAVPGWVSTTFETLQAPFVVVARTSLRRFLQRHDLADALEEEALTPMMAELVSSLSATAAAVNYAEFTAVRRARLGRLGEVMLCAGSNPGRELYDEHEAAVLADGFRERFGTFPFLARRLATMTRNHTDGIAELVRRRVRDADRLASTFSLPPDARLVRIEPTSGDTHGGRAVLRAVFEDGTELAYKPRPLRADRLWGELAQQISTRVGIGTFPAPKILDSGRWGWSQWVRHEPCRDESEVATAFRSAGLVLALGHALGTIDVHSENVVVDGPTMHVVDAEMAMQPSVDELEVASEAGEPPPPSVLDVGVLPSYAELARDEYVDIGVLGEPGDSIVRGTTWSARGTDAIERSSVFETMPDVAESDITLAGRRVRPEQHRSALLDGFTRAYDELSTASEHLGAHIANHGDVPIRVAVRGTWVYVRCLHRLCDADALASGVDQQIQAEVLWRHLDRLDIGHPLHDVVAHEVAALCEGDVPLFRCRAGTTRLERPAVIAGTSSAIENARRRIGTFDGTDRARQRRLIESALALRTYRVGDPIGTRAEPAHAVTNVADRALQVAVDVGRRLLADGVRGPDGGGLWWHGVEAVGRSGRRAALRRRGADLYAGGPGIAASFAALYACTADRAWQRAARDAALPHVAAIAASPEAFVRRTGYGAHGGAAGTALALRCTANLTGLDELDHAASAIIAALPALDSPGDDTFDVIDGLAGTILATLAVVGSPTEEHRSTIAVWAQQIVDGARARPPSPQRAGDARAASNSRRLAERRSGGGAQLLARHRRNRRRAAGRVGERRHGHLRRLAGDRRRSGGHPAGSSRRCTGAARRWACTWHARLVPRRDRPPVRARADTPVRRHLDRRIDHRSPQSARRIDRRRPGRLAVLWSGRSHRVLERASACRPGRPTGGRDDGPTDGTPRHIARRRRPDGPRDGGRVMPAAAPESPRCIGSLPGSVPGRRRNRVVARGGRSTLAALIAPVGDRCPGLTPSVCVMATCM